MPHNIGHYNIDVPIKIRQQQVRLHLFWFMSFKPLVAFIESTIIKYICSVLSTHVLCPV